MPPAGSPDFLSASCQHMQFFSFAKPPLEVIYCTPMNRPDSVLTLAMLYGLEGKKEARLGAVALTSASLGAARFCDAVSRFYIGTGPFINSNRYLPVGLDAETVQSDDSPMIKAVLERRDGNGQPQYSTAVRDVSDTAEIMALMRNALTSQNDGNAVIVLSASAGKLLGMLDLLGVPALVAAKVKLLVISGDLPDPDASRKLLAAWPSPVVFCGKDVGEALPFPGASIDKDFAWSPAHPVADAYRGFRKMPYDTPSQDVAAAFYAVHPDSGLFKLSEPGSIEFSADGHSKFVAGTGGKHHQLSVDASQKEKILQTFVELASAKPVPRQTRRRPAEAEAAKAGEKKTDAK